MCISELPSLSKYTVNSHDIVLTKRLSKKRHRNKSQHQNTTVKRIEYHHKKSPL